MRANFIGLLLYATCVRFYAGPRGSFDQAALLLALADLAVERGDQSHKSGSALPLPLALIAERFVSLYWGHVRPFPADVPANSSPLLSQNLGQNISLLRDIGAMQQHCPTLAQARASRQWPQLIAQAARLIQLMPLLKLQTLRTEARPFLYDNSVRDGAILLKEGVAGGCEEVQGAVVE